MRTTKRNLEDLAELISTTTGEEYTVGWAYGRPRLEAKSGSVDVSPRLPSGQLWEWMYAFYKGIIVGKEG